MELPWNILNCKKSQLCLDTVLVCGQSFRWKQNEIGEWLGVLSGSVWRLKQISNEIHYKVYCKEPSANNSPLEENTKQDDAAVTRDTCRKPDKVVIKKDYPRNANDLQDLKSLTVVKSEEGLPSCYSDPVRKGKIEKCDNVVQGKLLKREREIDTDGNASDELKFHEILQDYFQLNIDLDELCKYWSSKDKHFREVATQFTGIRMLRQDPVENLLSFVCSTNNHINRISSMVENLCTHYGDYITTVDGVPYYSFPSFSDLCGPNVESHLRELGFGYRAKYIPKMAHAISEKGGDSWVRSLREKSYSEAKTELTKLSGVGPKVADCVCLMSLDKTGVIPVDTHVWQITVKHYMPHLASAKSVTTEIYNKIGDFYRELWGPYAGWAHSVLFTADLKQNKDKAAQVEKEEGKQKQKPTKRSTKEVKTSGTQKQRKTRK